MKIIKPHYEIMYGLDISLFKDIEKIGRVCYKSEAAIKQDTAKEFVKKIIAMGHESVIEHRVITVRFICDRGVSHEIVRHRLASFSQESTRYCNYSADKFNNGIALIHPESLSEAQKLRRENHFWIVQDLYMKELSEGITPQIARGVLPTALKTEIVVTANLRQWRTMMKQRTSKKAHPQMTELMRPLLKDFQSFLPIIFDDITYE